MRGLVFVSLTLSACTIPPEPWGMTEITVHGNDQFKQTIGMAADEWNWALQERCGRAPIVIVPDGGNPVVEYGVQEWLDNDYGNNILGFFDGNQVAIRACLNGVYLNVPVHELGHALGLQHVKYEEDLFSVMVPFAFTDRIKPSPGDVDRAAEALGCP